jgi:hypothetical protein
MSTIVQTARATSAALMSGITLALFKWEPLGHINRGFTDANTNIYDSSFYLIAESFLVLVINGWMVVVLRLACVIHLKVILRMRCFIGVVRNN